MKIFGLEPTKRDIWNCLLGFNIATILWRGVLPFLFSVALNVYGPIPPADEFRVETPDFLGTLTYEIAWYAVVDSKTERILQKYIVVSGTPTQTARDNMSKYALDGSARIAYVEGLGYLVQ